MQTRDLEEAGLVAVWIDEGAEFRVELTSRATNTWVVIQQDIGSMHRWNSAESRPCAC